MKFDYKRYERFYNFSIAVFEYFSFIHFKRVFSQNSPRTSAFIAMLSLPVMLALNKHYRNTYITYTNDHPINIDYIETCIE